MTNHQSPVTSHQPTILITGASRGIGAATARAFARQGWHVLALARTVKDLEALDDHIQADGTGSCTIIPCDLNELELVDQIAPQLAERFGRLDALMLNADVSSNLQPMNAMDHKIWQKAFAVGVHAHMGLLRGCEPLLRAAPHAHVIGLTSDYANEPAPFWGMNGAVKAAFEAMLNTYALETANSDIAVHLHNPGRVATAWLSAAFPGKDLTREAITADTVAANIVALTIC